MGSLFSEVPGRSYTGTSPIIKDKRHRDARDVIRKEAWHFYRTISGVRLCWELEEPEGPGRGLWRSGVWRFEPPLRPPRMRAAGETTYVQGYLTHKKPSSPRTLH